MKKIFLVKFFLKNKKKHKIKIDMINIYYILIFKKKYLQLLENKEFNFKNKVFYLHF